MKLSLINESITSSDMEILNAWQRGEIEEGDNLHDSLLDIFKRFKTGVMIPESAPDIKVLKKHRKSLDSDEKEEAEKAGAVWDGDDRLAVWKSVVDGKTYYVSNTHRTYSANTSLKKTIKDFHDFVKESS